MPTGYFKSFHVRPLPLEAFYPDHSCVYPSIFLRETVFVGSSICQTLYYKGIFTFPLGLQEGLVLLQLL